jgi:hypothetical protein
MQLCIIYKVYFLYTIYATHTCYSIIAYMLRGHRSRRIHRYTENDVKPDENDAPFCIRLSWSCVNAVLHPHFASSVEAFTFGVMWLKQCHKLPIWDW